jgi:hypothetical protein
MRLVHSGATEADAVRELIQIAEGGVQLLTAGAELWRRSAENPMAAHGPAAATAAADLLDAAARPSRRHPALTADPPSPERQPSRTRRTLNTAQTRPCGPDRCRLRRR